MGRVGMCVLPGSFFPRNSEERKKKIDGRACPPRFLIELQVNLFDRLQASVTITVSTSLTNCMHLHQLVVFPPKVEWTDFGIKKKGVFSECE